MGITFGIGRGMARATPLPPSPFLREPSIYLTVVAAHGPMDGPLRGLFGAGF